MSKNKSCYLPRFDKISVGFLVYLGQQETEKRWCGIYELYLDVYFAENMLLDGAMLILTLILMGRKLCFLRLLVSSFLGGTAAVLLMLLQLRFGPLYILIVFIMGLLMLWIAMERKTLAELITGVFYFYIMSFVFTKLFGSIERLLGIGIAAGIMTICVMGCVIGYMLYRKKKERDNMVYMVCIEDQGRQIELKALFDTGNSLCDPVSGRPVSIVEKDAAISFYMQEKPEKYKVIPFHSIGKEHGILKGMEIDKLTIWRGDEKRVLNQAIIAFYEGKLSQDGSFQMILHQGMM